MTRIKDSTLRSQLVIAGLIGALLPVLIIVAVAMLTTNDVEILDGSAGTETTTEAQTPLVPLLIAASLLVGPTAIGVWRWTLHATRPIEQITSLADDIQAGSLDQRIELRHGPAEVQDLANSFDRMLDRLEQSSAAQRQLIEDANHDLRTPLAALHATIELALTDPTPTASSYHSHAKRAQKQAVRLETTLDSLLTQARSDEHSTSQADTDLDAILRRAVQQQQAIEPAARIVVRSDGPVHLPIDGSAVERAISNLLSNAVRHSPTDGTVTASIATSAEHVELAIQDEGSGIPPAALPFIFDRYYRANQNGAGAGVGLAIVKTVADSYGSVEVTSPIASNGGTRFTMRFMKLSPLQGLAT